MTFDDLSQAHLYRNMVPGLDLAFDYLQTFQADTPDGKYELDGDRVFALVQSLNTFPIEGRQFEAHRDHLDVQYLVSGEELIFHSPLSRLQIATEYSAEKDVAMYTGPDDQALHMTPGTFTILFPNDGHKPCVARSGSVPIRKVVVKVRLG